MFHDRIELDTKSNNAASDNSNLHERIMQGLSIHQPQTQVVESAQLRAVQDQRWQNGKVDFGTAGELYGQSKAAEHPFTPAEIADAGAIRAVVLNGIFTGNESSLDGDPQTSRPRVRPETTQDAPVNGLIGRAPSITGRESLPAHRRDILANLAQSGSAGVDQWTLPDCVFESAVASVASLPQGQKDISNMISLNKDGSYEVTFPGDPQHPINVTSHDLANKNIENSAKWANVLEAANLELNPQFAEHGGNGLQLSRKYLEQLTDHQPISVNLHRWAPAETYAEQQNDCVIGAERAQPPVEKTLLEGLSEGYAVEAGGARPGQPLESKHEYSVLGIRNGQVLVRNPWGNENTDKDNRFKARVGQTLLGVTNLGGGESSMSYDTFMHDLPIVTFDKP